MSDAKQNGERPRDVATNAGAGPFEAFSQIAIALEQISNVDDLLRVVARQAIDLFDVARASIHLQDDCAERFRGHVGQAGEKNLDADVRRMLAGIPADGVTLELLRTKRPVIVADARKDPRIIKSTVRYWKIRSMMAVPLSFDGDILGVLYLDNAGAAHVFTAAEAELAVVFGGLAGAAIKHALCMIELRSKLNATERQIKGLRRAAIIDDKLSELVLTGRSLRELVQTLAELLGKPCAVYDGNDVRLAMALPGGGDGVFPRLLESPCVALPEVRSALERNADSRVFIVGPLPNAGILHRYLVAPMMVDGELWGRLVVMEHRTRFSGGQMLMLRRAATLISLQMSTERKAVETGRDAGSSLAAELLRGCCDLPAAKRRAERLGVDIDTPHVVALIAARAPEAAPTNDFRAVVAAFGDVAPELTVHATTLDGGVAALVELPGGTNDEQLLSSAKDILGRVCAALGGAGELVASISSVRSDPEQYSEAYTEAHEVIECIRRFADGPEPVVLSAADLGAGRVFLATSDPIAVKRFAESTFGSLVRDASKADLLTTLCAFFDNMASIRRCALRLGVHENTIRYRLARIEELTGLPVTHDPDAQLRARLSLLVLMLQRRLPDPVSQNGASALTAAASSRYAASPVPALR